ncbi:hypothetical protein EDB85DRAFT_1887169 [Lactarius pseudohatsudake]|nr:hypothetical protein EDB85DRAFT_1887169 [Lactarius pseudohatsudake]
MPAFSVKLLSDPLLQYGAVEWTEEWLDGVGAHGGPGAEAQLRGMVEEVVWGNVIWYSISWALRGTSGRGMNTNFSKYALLYSVRTIKRRLTLALPTQCTRYLDPLPAKAYPQGGVKRLQDAQHLVCQSPAAAPDVPCCVCGLLFAPAEARAGTSWRQVPGAVSGS